jgi:hypothetical protein
MAQIFHPSANTLAKASIFGALLVIGALMWIAYELTRSPYITQAYVPREQPVQFSHEHHVGGLGIDCRYCHTSVTESYFAGIPNTKTCMTCHSQIWTNADLLAPVRASWRTGEPIAWTRVHDLGDFAHFPHDVHVNRGVSCVSCHGQVNEMPLMWKTESLRMQWCLDCHRDPAPHLRPREEVFNMAWHPDNDPEKYKGRSTIEIGRDLMEKYKINTYQLTNCSICHY